MQTYSCQPNGITKLSDSKELKEARLNIRIEPSLKDELQKAAKAENRTLANYVMNVLQESLKHKNSK